MIFIYRSHVNTTKVQHCMMVQSPITQAMSIKLLIRERERERDVYMSRSIESDGHHNFDVRVYIDHETWPNFFASVDNQDIRATGRVEGFSKA